MSALMGGDFRDGFRTGFISGGVTAWLCYMETPVSQPTGNVYLERVKNWFQGALGEFIATGNYSFSAGDALGLCGLRMR